MPAATGRAWASGRERREPGQASAGTEVSGRREEANGGDERVWRNLQLTAHDVSKQIWICAVAPTSRASAAIQRLRPLRQSTEETPRREVGAPEDWVRFAARVRRSGDGRHGRGRDGAAYDHSLYEVWSAVFELQN